mmetsp:Transcript_9451/g.34678  ORF Transcript_9451/g.34678 Transcript_9451/m.34678 type:complete len:375 (+) Transcript_9451:173-1297(+)
MGKNAMARGSRRTAESPTASNRKQKGEQAATQRVADGAAKTKGSPYVDMEQGISSAHSASLTTRKRAAGKKDKSKAKPKKGKKLVQSKVDTDSSIDEISELSEDNYSEDDGNEDSSKSSAPSPAFLSTLFLAFFLVLAGALFYGTIQGVIFSIERDRRGHGSSTLTRAVIIQSEMDRAIREGRASAKVYQDDVTARDYGWVKGEMQKGNADQEVDTNRFAAHLVEKPVHAVLLAIELIVCLGTAVRLLYRLPLVLPIIVRTMRQRTRDLREWITAQADRIFYGTNAHEIKVSAEKLRERKIVQDYAQDLVASYWDNLSSDQQNDLMFQSNLHATMSSNPNRIPSAAEKMREVRRNLISAQASGGDPVRAADVRA